MGISDRDLWHPRGISLRCPVIARVSQYHLSKIRIDVSRRSMDSLNRLLGEVRVAEFIEVMGQEGRLKAGFLSRFSLLTVLTLYDKNCGPVPIG